MKRKQQVYESVLIQLENRLKDFLSTSVSLLEAVRKSGQLSEKHKETFILLASEFKKLEAKAQEVKEKIAQLEKEKEL